MSEPAARIRPKHQRAGRPTPRFPPRTKPIAIRFDESTIRRVKALAHHRGKGYQTLLKEFVTERLYEEEKREGLVGVRSSIREGRVVPTNTTKPRAVRGGYASGSKP